MRGENQALFESRNCERDRGAEPLVDNANVH